MSRHFKATLSNPNQQNNRQLNRRTTSTLLTTCCHRVWRLLTWIATGTTATIRRHTGGWINAHHKVGLRWVHKRLEVQEFVHKAAAITWVWHGGHRWGHIGGSWGWWGHHNRCGLILSRAIHIRLAPEVRANVITWSKRGCWGKLSQRVHPTIKYIKSRWHVLWNVELVNWSRWLSNLLTGWSIVWLQRFIVKTRATVNPFEGCWLFLFTLLPPRVGKVVSLRAGWPLVPGATVRNFLTPSISFRFSCQGCRSASFDTGFYFWQCIIIIIIIASESIRT